MRATKPDRRDPGDGDRCGRRLGRDERDHQHQPCRRDTEQAGPPARRRRRELRRRGQAHPGHGHRCGRGGAHHEATQLGEQPDARRPRPSGRPARSVSSSRYRPVSSIGTTARPSVTAAAQSASARTTVAAGAACG